MTTSLLEHVIFWTIMWALVLRAFQVVFFLPYRNPFMCWFMFRYSKQYRTSKNLFEELIEIHKECRLAALSDADGYYKFMERLQNDTRFRSTEDLPHSFSKAKALFSENIISDAFLPHQEVELFVNFSGKGANCHKLIVWFNLSEEIHLQSIQLIYHEEKKVPPFYHLIKKKKYPRDDDRKGRERLQVQVPGPTHAKEIEVS